ncbi:hypothetical protein [Bdellovibrio sp. HCB274]|uniref:hypothetical protein n=1 Tax=Bdellovibrio sp. HCB274 TaxID=3394361 RepID=UPI0039B4E3F8
MNKIIMLAMLTFGSHAMANQVVSVRACSSYSRAPIEDHEHSAKVNFIYEAGNACLKRGSLDWDVVDSRIYEGFKAPDYCISGRVVCY